MKRIKNGGRTKGTPNKYTKFQREFIQDLLDMQLDKIKAELNILTGKPYLDSIFTLIEYTLPKLNKTVIQEVEEEIEKPTIKLPDGTIIEI